MGSRSLYINVFVHKRKEYNLVGYFELKIPSSLYRLIVSILSEGFRQMWTNVVYV